MKKVTFLIGFILMMVTLSATAQAKKPIKKAKPAPKKEVVSTPVVAPVEEPKGIQPEVVAEPKVAEPVAEEKKQTKIGGFFKKAKDKIAGDTKPKDSTKVKKEEPKKEESKKEIVKKEEVSAPKTEEPKKKKSKRVSEFATVWESEFDNKATVLAVTNSDGSFVLGTDDNSATVLDGAGKIVWSGDYKKLTTNKTNKCEYQYVIWKNGGGYLFLFDARAGADRVAVLDVATGKEMWASEAYQHLITRDTNRGDIETVKYIDELDAFLISQKESVLLLKAKTGEKIWETNRFKGGVGKYVYDASKNEIIMLNFKPTSLGALFSGFKNQLVKINATNGDLLWDATFVGIVEKELITRKFIVDLTLKDNKVFLYLNGLQVYNSDNGQKLWETTYENDMEGGGGFMANKDQKIYRTLADPLFTNNAVYITMFGGRDRAKYIEKHDLESGKLLWTSEKITGALCIPNIYKAGNKLMCQVGGKVQVQGFRNETVMAPTGGTMKIRIPFIEWQYKTQKNRVLALDDTTGKTAWSSEKFDKRITDFVLDAEKTLFVGDGDQFYSYDIPTGNQLFDVKHDDAKVGRAMDVMDFEDKVVVLSEKGLAAYHKKDGSRAYTTGKVGRPKNFYHIGDNYFLQDNEGSKNQFVGIDMTTGTVKGFVESKGKGGSPQYGNGIDITTNGESIFAFKGKKVEKVRVNN